MIIIPIVALVSIIIGMVFGVRAIYEDDMRVRWIWLGVAFMWLGIAMFNLVLYHVLGGVK